MNWRDATDQAGVNLRQAPLRAALTISGVAIGIGMMVCLVGFGLGLQQVTTAQVSRFGQLDRVTVTARGERGRPDRGATAPAAVLDDEALRRIAELPGVAGAAPVIVFPLRLSRSGWEHTAIGRTFAAPVDGVSPPPLETGAWFGGDDAAEVVLHPEVAAALGWEPAASAVGGTVTAAVVVPSPDPGGGFSVRPLEVELRVTGVLAPGVPGPAMPGLRDDVRLPLGTVRRLGLDRLRGLETMLRRFDSRPGYAAAEVRLVAGPAGDGVEAAIEAMGLRTTSLRAVLRQMRQVFLLMDAVLGAVGGVSLLVAALGIANTLIVAVLERRHEIGVRKAVGATRAGIRRLFLAEGGLIGLVGGGLGLLMGWAAAAVLNVGLNLYIESQGGHAERLFAFPAWLLGAAVLFAVAVAVTAALYPAARAARLDPVQSLRHE